MDQTKTELATLRSDRTTLTQLEPWELQYYAFNFNCTEEALKAALDKVGSSPDDLRDALAD